MVDEMKRRVADEAIALAARDKAAAVSRFISNPDRAELDYMLPRFIGGGIASLDVSYCLQMAAPPLLADLLSTATTLTALDLTACGIGDEGAAVVGAALAAAGSDAGGAPLASLCLRANRIGPNGASAVGAGAAASPLLTRLDLSVNPLGDVGVMRLILGDPGGDANGGGANGANGGGANGGGESGNGGEPSESSRRRAARRAASGGHAAERDAAADAADDAAPRGLHASNSLTALLLSKVGLGARGLRAVALLAHGLATLSELDLSVNAFCGVDEWAAGVRVDASTVSGRAMDARAAALASRELGTSAADWEWSTGAAMRSVGRALGACPALRRVAIQHCAPKTKVGVCVAAALHPTLSAAPVAHLNLQGTFLSEAGLAELCAALTARGARGAAHLNLEGCVRRAHKALPALWRLIRSADAPIASLNLGFNDLTQGADLGRALAENNGTLTELDLGSNALGGEHVAAGVVALCGAFSDALTCSLASIDLSYMDLGVAGAKAVGALLLTRKCAVRSMRLDGCGLGADGLGALCAALADTALCADVTSMRLEYNGMGAEGALSLAGALRARPSLEALFIGCNGLGEAGARALGGGLSASASLRTLDAGDNDLDQYALRHILDGVRSQAALTALDVSNNRFGDAGAAVLAAELRTNPRLRFVRAAGNEIGGAGGAALVTSLAETASEALLLDLTHNPAVQYRDLTAAKLSNARKASAAGPSPLDGWGKQEE